MAEEVFSKRLRCSEQRWRISYSISLLFVLVLALLILLINFLLLICFSISSASSSFPASPAFAQDIGYVNIFFFFFLTFFFRQTADCFQWCSNPRPRVT